MVTARTAIIGRIAPITVSSGVFLMAQAMKRTLPTEGHARWRAMLQPTRISKWIGSMPRAILARIEIRKDREIGESVHACADNVRRRDLIALHGGAAGVWPFAVGRIAGAAGERAAYAAFAPGEAYLNASAVAPQAASVHARRFRHRNLTRKNVLARPNRRQFGWPRLCRHYPS